MGYYTELCLGVRFKRETPKAVIDAITLMLQPLEEQNAEDWKDCAARNNNHKLFSLDRSRWMLNSGGSYYFQSKPVRYWGYDANVRCWFLTVWTNIKNYESEWETFLSFISAWIEKDGLIGFIRGEDQEIPTLLYGRDSGVVMEEGRRVTEDKES